MSYRFTEDGIHSRGRHDGAQQRPNNGFSRCGRMAARSGTVKPRTWLRSDDAVAGVSITLISQAVRNELCSRARRDSVHGRRRRWLSRKSARITGNDLKGITHQLRSRKGRSSYQRGNEHLRPCQLRGNTMYCTHFASFAQREVRFPLNLVSFCKRQAPKMKTLVKSRDFAEWMQSLLWHGGNFLVRRMPVSARGSMRKVHCLASSMNNGVATININCIHSAGKSLDFTEFFLFFVACPLAKSMDFW